MVWLRAWRRRKLKARTFPAAWQELLWKRSLLYRHLPAMDREELHGHIRVFVTEKRFEGAGGLLVTDEVRVLVASQACLLLLHRSADYFPGLYSIVIYPSGYLAPKRERDQVGAVVEAVEARAGETWARGTLVLAWDAVLAGAAGRAGCSNVVIHEFAHQLDYQTGEADGAPLLPRDRYPEWSRVWGREYARLQHALAQGLPVDISPYGAKNPAEFFAVVVEQFFMCPRALSSRHPGLYRQLQELFRQDPASWLPR
ncbi:TPA: zinc-dependent peptidase [Candidatus Bipolaricaulota bacterium]|nr:zinc-dependent peptidase [Candidatus Bipolaricaulota bacterium]